MKFYLRYLNSHGRGHRFNPCRAHHFLQWLSQIKSAYSMIFARKRLCIYCFAGSLGWLFLRCGAKNDIQQGAVGGIGRL